MVFSEISKIARVLTNETQAVPSRAAMYKKVESEDEFDVLVSV